MSLENLKPKTEIIYYGKKAYYLNKELAQKIEPEQIGMKFAFEGIDDENTNHLH